MCKNLYEVKNLLEEANYMENYAKRLLEYKRTKQNKSQANLLIGKAMSLEDKAENMYAEIVGVQLHHKELKDLFGIQ